jgi:uncharacterized membrane protein
MITVTGTVFSITIVALSLASQQFGPRLLRRFMNDWPTQFTLAVFLSTGFFCLFSLRAIYGDERVNSADLAVTVAELLAALSVGMLIMYIHHIAVMLQATTIVAAVAEDLDESVEHLFPEMVGEPAQVEPDDGERTLARVREERGEPLRIASQHEGYVQAIDAEELLELAAAQDLVLRMLVRPGDFIVSGAPLAEFWGHPGRAPDADGAIASDVNGMLIVGSRSTPRQDVEAAVEELVQVAVRALSPGINDPFTAINCIDRLGESLGRLAARDWPSGCRSDEGGTLRVAARTFDFPGVLDTAFHSIRQYARGHVAVTVRLLQVLERLTTRLRRPADLDAVRRHGEMIARGLEACPEELDRRDARERHESLVAALEERRRELSRARGVRQSGG